MASEQELLSIVQKIHAEEELFGVTIGYHGNDECRVLHDGLQLAKNYARLLVIVEETTIKNDAQLKREIVQKSFAPREPVISTKPNPWMSNHSRIGSELLGAGLSCGFAALAAAGVAGGVATEVPSGGLSTVLTVAAWTGMLSSGAQCLNGLTRTLTAISFPESNTLDRWDENACYKGAVLFVDVAGMFGGASGSVANVVRARRLQGLLERSGRLADANHLRQLAPDQRKIAVAKALQEASQTPRARQELLKAMQEAGLTSNQITSAFKHGGGTLRRAGTLAKAINQDTAKRLTSSLRDQRTFGAAILANAAPSAITGSASGVVNTLIVHVMNYPEE